MRPGAVIVLAAAVGAFPGARGTPAQDWTTAGHDAQRSGWVRGEGKISRERMRQPGFQLLWKLNVGGDDSARAGELAPPVLLDLLIGYRGFRSLGFLGWRSGRVVAVDTDLGRLEWERRFTPTAVPSPGCREDAAPAPRLARPTSVALPVILARGRGGVAARSAVGEPGQGAVTLAELAARRRAAATSSKPPVERPNPHPFPVVDVVSSDGLLHTLNVMDGVDADAPAPFLPPNAAARGLIVVDDVAYAATTSECGSVPSGVWALDFATKQVATWRAVGGIAGAAGPAFGPDSTIYVATTDGALVALEPRTLKPKRTYRTGGPGFMSSPVMFAFHERILIAASARDGRIHLLDSHGLTGAGEPPRAFKTPVYSKSGAPALASWADSDGTRWLLAAEPLLPGDTATGGMVAWKVVERGEAPTLEPGWVSLMTGPLAPVVINGVVFAVSGSTPAVLHALDGATGKELWNSGGAITSAARGGVAGGVSEVYVGADDGTVYAFGFPLEH